MGRRATRPPTTMTDQELAEASLPTPWERRLFPLRCTVAVAAGVAMFAAVAGAAWRRPSPGNIFGGACGGLWAGASVMLFTFLPLFALLERRRSRYWRELERRYAGLRADDYLPEVEAEVQSAADSDLVVLVSGSALPHGGHWLVKVRLAKDRAGGTVQYRSLSPVVPPQDQTGRVGFTTGEAPLTGDQTAQVRALAAGPFPKFFKEIMSTVTDGAPAELLVWRRDAGVVGRGRCNLSGVPPEKEAVPFVRLIRLVSELGRKVPSPPLLAGSYDPRRNEIRLEEA
jgi:hypothetical protein